MSSDKSKPIILVGHVKGDPAELPEYIRFHPARDPDSPRRVVKDVQVTDKVELIAWTRRAYEANIDHRFACAIQDVNAGDWVFLEARSAIACRPYLAAIELRRIMHNELASPKGRARAAEVLSNLGHADGGEFIIAALDSESDALCAAAVEMLNGVWKVKLEITKDVLAKIARILRSPSSEVVKKVAHFLSWNKIPEIEETLRDVVIRGEEPLDELAEALVRTATTPASVHAAIPYLFRRRQKEYRSSIGFLFREILEHRDQTIAEPVRFAMRNYLLTYPDNDRLGQHWAGDIAMVADETVLPVLEEIVARASDPVSRAYALRAISKLQPAQAVVRVLEEIKRDRAWQMLIDILREYAVESDFDRVSHVMFHLGRDKQQPLSLNEIRLIWESFGHRGREFLTKHSDSLEGHAREWLTWKLKGLSIQTALDDLHKCGVFSQDPTKLLTMMIKNREDNERTFDPTEPAALFSSFAYANLATHFDTETGFVPCHHEELIQRFTENSNGKFALECPLQIWHRQNEDDFDGPYTIQFIYRNRLYQFAAENYGDYYDVEAVVDALNETLKIDGQPERYIGLHTGDQCACFVFADPAKLLPIADKYGLPLAKHASDAMRAGRAYEDRMFTELDTNLRG